MPERRIAIVGGGMAALAAAFELTRTEDLRARNKVTIYQMGWRLGGKAASGRDSKGRVVEHGLHIWFGFYENAFSLLKAAYSEWSPPTRQAITTWDAALRPQEFAAIGNGDTSDIVVMRWPRVERGSPGDGTSDLSLARCIDQLIYVVDRLFNDFGLPGEALVVLDPDLIANINALPLGLASKLKIERPFLQMALKIALVWADNLALNPKLQTTGNLLAIASFLRAIARTMLGTKEIVDLPNGKFLAQLLDVGSAVIYGVILDILIRHKAIAELDRMEFREWLSLHGASRETVYRSRVVKALYDSMFQYSEGDLRRPSYGAGTAAQVVLRLYGTYREAYAYEMQAGMGEVVVAPVYDVLRRRGVRFEFFHKLTHVEVDASENVISRLHFARQVYLKDKNKPYDALVPPTSANGYLTCWPDAPRWDLIQDGIVLSTKNLDFESHWCDFNVERDVSLERGNCFDDVLLAIPLGAFKRLNTSRGPCDELISRGERFRAMTENLTLVPSISVQAWCTRDLSELGWPPPEASRSDPVKVAMSSGPPPLNIWADMSQVLKFEPWEKPPEGPKSLHYLCSVLSTSLYRADPGKHTTPTKAKDLAHKRAFEWFTEKAHYLWPKSLLEGRFDWDVLFAPPGTYGPARLGAQVMRANVDPVACCVASAAGSTEWRLKTDESGFAHLYLAGSWISTGFDTECIEAAVMAGMQAARALCGSPMRVQGEHFLHQKRLSIYGEIGALIIEGALGVLSVCRLLPDGRGNNKLSIRK